MKAKIAQWGNSLAVRIPREIAENARLVQGDIVEIGSRDGEVILARVAVRKYPSWAQMQAQAEEIGLDCEPATVDWGPDVGTERLEPWPQ